MIKRDWIRPGAAVVDLGISRAVRNDRTTLGATGVNSRASGSAGAITSIPGGVGPMMNEPDAQYLHRGAVTIQASAAHLLSQIRQG